MAKSTFVRRSVGVSIVLGLVGWAGADPRPSVLPTSDSDKEAADYAADIKVVRISLESGRTLTAGNLASAENFGKQSGEKFQINVYDAPVVHGSPEVAVQKLLDIQALHNADEIIVVTAINDFQKRLRSYELLSQAMIDRGNISAKGQEMV